MRQKNSPFIIPSTLYNTMVFNVMEEIAADIGSTASVTVKHEYGKTEYVLSEHTEGYIPSTTSRIPFESVEPQAFVSISYRTRTKDYVSHTTDELELTKKYFFANEEEYSEHREKVKNILLTKIQETKVDEEQ